MGNIVLTSLSFNGTLVFLLFIHCKSKLSKVCSKILLVFDVKALIESLCHCDTAELMIKSVVCFPI